MNKIITFVVSLLVSISAISQSIKIKGSDTMLPLMQLQIEAYLKKNPANINVTGGGSGVGITALLDGSADIAMSSRDLKLSEKLKFEEKGIKIVELNIANDALSVIVNPQNKITQLKREQLESIFRGEISNWKQVGGDDQKIVIYTRESSSGTYEFMKEHVLNKHDFSPKALSTSATAGIVHGVGGNVGAIGYVGLAYVEPVVKAIFVSYDGGQKYIAPTFNNAINKVYPITRPLFLYYNAANSAKIKPFLDFVLSIYGQKLVTHKGYIPLK